MGDMQARSLVHHCTDAAGLEAHLGAGGAGCRAYVGFDPTADSLTIGNLVGIMALARFQRAGHTPVAVMGGATGLIGDPSGKTAERTLSTRDEVAGRVERIGRIFAGGEVFDTTGALPRLVPSMAFGPLCGLPSLVARLCRYAIFQSSPTSTTARAPLPTA